MADPAVVPLLSQEPQESEGIENHDAHEYDKEEEMLLLQMADTNDGPLSPNLKAVIDGSNESNWTAGQKEPAPLLMERPQSSGIDVRTFSFAKPAQYGKGFSLQSSYKQPPAVSRAHGNTPVPKGRETTRASSGHSEISQKETEEGPQASTKSPSALPLESQGHNKLLEHASREPTLNSDTNPAQNRRTEIASPPPVNNPQNNGPPELNNITSLTEDVHDRRPISQRHGEKRQRRGESSRQPMPINHIEFEVTPSTLRPCAPETDETRPLKRRRTNSRKRLSCFKQSEQSIVDDYSQLSEDNLFQMLIGRIRQREENEIAAASLREQMETTVLELTEENKALKEQLEMFGAQLQKRTSDCRAYRAQMDSWKTKLGKFKRFLNSLGNDYQTLRGEAIQFKARRASLEEEKGGIKRTISDLKVRISQIADTMSQKRNHLRESANIVGSLEQALKGAEDKVQLIQNHLSDEKRKSAILESYIQSHSRTQTKQLGLIKTDQLEIMSKLESAFQSISEQWESSQTNIQSMLSPALNECLSSVKELNERYSMNKTDTQLVSDAFHWFMTRMDSITAQLTKEFEKGSEANGNMVNVLQVHLRNIEDGLGSDSALFKKLAVNDQLCGSLYEKLDLVGPNIFNLTSCLNGLEEKETSLSQQMEELGRSLAAQKPDEEAALTPEIIGYMTENTRLQLRVQEISAELNSKDENLKIKEMESDNMKDSLVGARTKVQEAEDRATQLESETTSLREKINSIETKVREELNRASVVSRDQIKARFEQQIHKLLKEKSDIENDAGNVREQLANAQESLVQNKATMQKKQADYESSLQEKQQQMQILQDSHIEYINRLTTQDAELRRYRELEASAVSQQDSLLKHLDEANERIESLENQLSLKDDKAQSELQELQRKVESLEEEFSKKKEECLSVQKDLDAANSVKSSLESGKLKAKDEIHALLRRVQDSEEWMKSIRDTLQKLGILKPEEPFAETWNRLEVLLKTAVSNNAITAVINCPEKDSTVNHGANSPESIALAATPRGGSLIPSQGFFQTTELIYRTQSIQESLYASPDAYRHIQSIAASNTVPSSFPGSQVSNSIVPFSSIQQQLSPRYCSSPSQVPDDLANMLIPASEKQEEHGESTITQLYPPSEN
ncbi:hypothetical protein MW887_006150 [Aspergillus wentii]|nr:hypothetical protein MW887_006150 [Aspergillus wentii]